MRHSSIPKQRRDKSGTYSINMFVSKILHGGDKAAHVPGDFPPTRRGGRGSEHVPSGSAETRPHLRVKAGRWRQLRQHSTTSWQPARFSDRRHTKLRADVGRSETLADSGGRKLSADYETQRRTSS